VTDDTLRSPRPSRRRASSGRYRAAGGAVRGVGYPDVRLRGLRRGAGPAV